MFTAQERDEIHDRLVELARADPAVTGAAITGSRAGDESDRWSDIDLFFGVAGQVDAAIARFTDVLYRDFDAVHHWDLPAGPSIYRVFLMPGWLQVDLGFTPEATFGVHGPSWRLIFGRAADLKPPVHADPRSLIGLAWHHSLHARICIERGRTWQAEYWIGALRAELLALGCLRHGYPTAYAKGAHLLPAEITDPLEAALVRSLDTAELNRALDAALAVFAAELERGDSELTGRLGPMLAELGPV
jgi:hypothetical protein